MLARFFIVGLGVAASLLLVRHIERTAQHVRGELLPRWARLLIPIPIILFLLGNLDGVLSLIAYLDDHHGAVPVRYSENQAWNADRFCYAGTVSVVLLPFSLGRRFYLHKVSSFPY